MIPTLTMGASSYTSMHDHATRGTRRQPVTPRLPTGAGTGHDVGVSPLKGKPLLATPPLVDPNFDRTVVLMLEHGQEGALGLVLNRPTEEDVDELLPAWRPLITGDPVLFDGGPVEHAAVIGLAWVRTE